MKNLQQYQTPEVKLLELIIESSLCEYSNSADQVNEEDWGSL